jgi:predicted transcriptional regulator
MISEMHAVAHSMPIGHFFNTEHRIDTFDGETSMRDVLEYFSACAADAVIITEEALWAGIVTVKDIIKGLHNWDNLLLPIRNFMTAPLQTFNEQKLLRCLKLSGKVPIIKSLLHGRMSFWG